MQQEDKKMKDQKEINSAISISREILTLVENEDYGGRYEQLLREFCGIISHWATAKNGSGNYLTYRLPDGHCIRVAPHHAMPAKDRAVRAWAKIK